MSLIKAAVPGYVDVARMLIGAAADGRVDEVRAALAAGANVNQANKHGHTALVVASWWRPRPFSYTDTTAVVEVLLAAGANVNFVNDKGDTALIRASSWGHTAIVEMLLAAGANANIVNDEGDTALSLASGVATVALFEDAKGIRARHLLGKWRAAVRVWRITNYWWRVAGEGQHAPNMPGRKRDRDAYVAEYI